MLMLMLMRMLVVLFTFFVAVSGVAKETENDSKTSESEATESVVHSNSSFSFLSSSSFLYDEPMLFDINRSQDEWPYVDGSGKTEQAEKTEKRRDSLWNGAITGAVIVGGGMGGLMFGQCMSNDPVLGCLAWGGFFAGVYGFVGMGIGALVDLMISETVAVTPVYSKEVKGLQASFTW